MKRGQELGAIEPETGEREDKGRVQRYFCTFRHEISAMEITCKTACK